MSGVDLQGLWQESEEAPAAFTVGELAHRAPPQEAGAASLSAECSTFLEATLEAHRVKTAWRLQLRESFAAERALVQLRELTGRPQRPVSYEPALALGLAIVLTLTLMLMLVVGAGLALRPPPPAPALALQLPVNDPADEFEDPLVECRTWSDPSAGTVDWPRANAACQQVLELEPLHPEANVQMKRIAVLSVCERQLQSAQKEFAAGRLEAAVESLAQLGGDCELYLLHAMAIAKDAVAELKTRAARDCRAYVTAGRWDVALKHCELYSRLACQTLDPAQLYPHPLLTLKLEGPLDPKTQWRPADPLYVDFLKARAKLTPGAPPWRCPDVPAFRAPPAAPDPAALAKGELAARYPEPELGRALVLYFQGDFAGAPVRLQKVMEQMDKAPFHDEARSLLLDLNDAINLYENGLTELLANRPERAEVQFLAALAIDERLVLGPNAATLTADEKKRELERRESFVRKNIIETMATSTYEKGRVFADRKDFRAACRIWKVGLSFSRRNIDLLMAVTNACTARASKLLEGAETCAQLEAVLDFAVDGDGLREKAAEAMERAGCRK